jgi:hypothetical protein
MNSKSYKMVILVGVDDFNNSCVTSFTGQVLLVNPINTKPITIENMNGMNFLVWKTKL